VVTFDPLDGNYEFLRTAIPVFCVSLAVEATGQRIAGVIYDPTRDEMFAAELGSGTRLNGEAIHVSATANLGECLVATGFPSHKRHKSPKYLFLSPDHVAYPRGEAGGSAALDLCNVASGPVRRFLGI